MHFHDVQVVRFQVWVLPARWSLYYAFNKTCWWKKFRERVKEYLGPAWQLCACPLGCQATDLDEEWDYDREARVKRFKDARFICKGCHWVKSPEFRQATWRRQQEGRLPPLEGEPHIKRCLGWSDEKIEELRRIDMLDEIRDDCVKKTRDCVSGKLRLEEFKSIQDDAKNRGAIPADYDIADLLSRVHEKAIHLVDETKLWDLDLSGLSKFGYTDKDIADACEKMQSLARKRIDSGEVYYSHDNLDSLREQLARLAVR